MTNPVRTRLALAAGALALAGPAALAQDYDGATRLVLEDAVATVAIERGDTLSVAGLDGEAMTLRTTRRGDTVTVSGPEALDEDAFWAEYMDGRGGVRIGPIKLGGGNRSITVRNGRDARFEAMLEAYPDLTLTVPEGLDLRLEGSALLLSGEAALGRVEAEDNLYLMGRLGDADSARLRMKGPGNLALGDVAGLMDAELSGSGDIEFGDAGSAVLTLRGSGDIEGEDISGDAAMTLQGSGDVEADRIGGKAEMVLRGSGDIEAEEVAGGLDAELTGSGDVSVGRVLGPVTASLRGSGDVEINEGRAERFEATLSGSGDIAFGGVAVNPKLRTSGSGDIVVGDAEGTVDARGDGIRVGGKPYGDSD